MFRGKFAPLVDATLVAALKRLAAGDEGSAQSDGGEYETFFTPEDAWLDLSRPAAEVYRLVWAWRYGMLIDGTEGALLVLDGKTVRVLAASLIEIEGKPRLECADGPLWVVETEELSDDEAAIHGTVRIQSLSTGSPP